MDARKILTVYDTVQVQITNLRLQREDINGLTEEVDLAIGHCGDCSPLDLHIAEQVESKVYIFRDSVLCFEAAITGKGIELSISSKLHHIARELVEFVWRMFAGHGTLQILAENTTDVFGGECAAVFTSSSGSSRPCPTTFSGTRSMLRKSANTTQPVLHPLSKASNQVDGLVSGDEEKWSGSLIHYHERRSGAQWRRS